MPEQIKANNTFWQRWEQYDRQPKLMEVLEVEDAILPTLSPSPASYFSRPRTLRSSSMDLNDFITNQQHINNKLT